MVRVQVCWHRFQQGASEASYSFHSWLAGAVRAARRRLRKLSAKHGTPQGADEDELEGSVEERL